MRNRNISYTEETEYEQSQRRRSKSAWAIVIMLVLIVAILALVWYKYYRQSKTFNSYTVNAVNQVTDGSKYMRYADGYVRYTSDGAEAVKGDTVLWNVSYSMKKPVADTSGDYCVFADKGHQDICITDGTGANYHISVPDKIVDVRVASQGVVAVWTDSVDTDNIFLYDVNGTLLLDIATDIAADGFPIAFDLSPDGTKLVTSYIKIDDELTTWVTFYNFSAVGQNYSDRVVGSYSFPGTVIPGVKFAGNERVCVFTDNGCIIYRMKETPSELASCSAPRLAAIANDDKYVCLAEDETDGTTTLTIFDVDGQIKKKIVTGISYTGMYMEDSELIIYNNASCIIFNLDGSEKFRTQMDNGIKSVFPAGHNKYYFIGANEVRQITLKSEG
ncbi:MAG: DUF5711 family protein [Lachnospiraceae bacterium]|nr:DUF5711 family protein [Lachnospiraceae bacterium]